MQALIILTVNSYYQEYYASSLLEQPLKLHSSIPICSKWTTGKCSLDYKCGIDVLVCIKQPLLFSNLATIAS